MWNMRKAVWAAGVMALAACQQVKVPSYDGEMLWFQNMANDSKTGIAIEDSTATLKIVREELKQLTIADSVIVRLAEDQQLGNEGFEIKAEGRIASITAQTETGLLYGAYAVLRDQKSNGKQIVSRRETPAYDLRMLNHWDNLDGTVERGYAGKSIWHWDGDSINEADRKRYELYAKANASIGINATVINNVNASPEMLSEDILKRVAEIADILRPYGIKTFLSVNFSSPIKLAGTVDADPLRAEVRSWWKDKADEIYGMIPDFGGFLVKANSEGLPGPLDYGRTHVDGANMLAEALAPHNGVVLWRAFVYSPTDADRAKQAYLEFQPYDGQFADNVIIQIKNGPIDFQPREPFSPLFGALKKTQMAAELQITQEYTGASNHLCYLATMWAETLEDDTYRDGEGSTIAKLTTSKAANVKKSAIAGVANIGDDSNWCGHPMAQANWYAFGRMAWNTSITPDSIAEEWIRQTMPAVPLHAENTLKDMMMESREAVVDYMMPLGLHHIFAWGHHYGPEPWCDIPGAREDWMPRYYHKADSAGLGSDRSPSGSNATAQYNEPLASQFADINTCPEKYILWFHHVDWNHRMQSGQTLWNELCLHYDKGMAMTGHFVASWRRIKPYVDGRLWSDVNKKLEIQRDDARWWHDACLLYFQTFSGEPIAQKTIYSLDNMMDFHINITNYECAPKGYRGE